MVLVKSFVVTLTIIYLTIQQSCLTGASDWSVDKANEYIAENKQNVNGSYRLKYHLMPPIGWINDPNGFIYFRGEYHLFYQYNPYDVSAGQIHWGHAKSKDLLQWEDLPVAMAPDQVYDNLGVFSGSAIEKDGKLYVMYTGANADGQVQCIAVSEDGIHFEKAPENPVIDASKLPSNAMPKEFRDPKVFKRGDDYFVVTVSETDKGTGQVLLHQSADLINWEFKSIFLEGTKKEGIMYECPDLFEMDGKYVLTVSAIEMPRSGNEYQNYDSVIAFVGEVDWDKGIFTVESMKELDHGQDFYATQTLLDDKGRRIVVAWMNMWKRSYPTADLNHGWVGAMTLPRVLKIEDNNIKQIPVSEIYRNAHLLTDLNNITFNDESREFEHISGEVGILDLVINLEEATFFTVELRANGNEKTVLSYNTDSEELTLDRSNSGVDIDGVENPPISSRRVKVPLENNKLKLQIFLDQSSVEVFVNDGLETFSATIFPTEEPSDKIQFKVEGKAVAESLAFSKIELENKQV